MSRSSHKGSCASRRGSLAFDPRSASSAPTAKPSPSPSRDRHGRPGDEMRADRRQLRLPQVREVGDAADEPDHRTDQQDPVERLDAAAAQSPDRYARRDPHDDRDEVVAEELQRLDQLGARRGRPRRSSCGPCRPRPARPAPRSRPGPAVAAKKADGEHRGDEWQPRPAARTRDPRERTVHVDRLRRVSEHDRPLRIDRVHDVGDAPATNRAAARCPSSECGGRAKSRCATPRCAANAAASKRPCSWRSRGPAWCPRASGSDRWPTTADSRRGRADRRGGTAPRRSRARRCRCSSGS